MAAPSQAPIKTFTSLDDIRSLESRPYRETLPFSTWPAHLNFGIGPLAVGARLLMPSKLGLRNRTFQANAWRVVAP